MVDFQELPHWLYNEFQACGVDYANLEVARNFEKRHLHFRNFQEEFDRVCSRTGLNSESVALDLGCGSGAFIIPASRLCHRVYGADISENMLNLLKEKLDAQNIKNVALYHAGFLTFWEKEDRPKQFDFIISSIALHHLPDFWKAVAIQHIANALKPEGVFYLYDVIFNFPITKWHDGVQRFLDEMEAAAGREASKHISSEYSSFSWIIEGILERAGLKIEQVYDDTSFLRAYVCRKLEKNDCPPVLSVAQARELDVKASQDWNIPTLILMENAARSIAEIFVKNVPKFCAQKTPQRVLICCGKGNNGGDGLALFRRLELLGIDCRVAVSSPYSDYKNDALVNLNIVRHMIQNTPEKLFYIDGSDVSLHRLNDEIKRTDWVVDALLGTGAAGALRPPYDKIVSAINASGKPTLAIDVPSGLNADDGSIETEAVKATITVTLATLKPGLLMGQGKSYVGDLHVGDIGTPIDQFLVK